jgi:protein-disulfide isomerase
MKHFAGTNPSTFLWEIRFMVIFSRTLGTLVVLLSLLIAGPALAKKGDDMKALQAEVEAIKQGQVQIQKDLAEIKKLLQDGARAAPKTPARAAFAPTDTQLGNVPYKGESDAPVTLIEFSDYQCPYCKRHATQVMPTLVSKYVDSGQLRIVMREYPIENLHRRAVPTSEAALCAGDQGKYWEMHDSLFNDQKANTDEDFQQMAASLELDVAAFTECMSSDQFMNQIKADMVEGQRLGISGTPSFVVGLTDPEDSSKVHLTKFIRGAQSEQAFSAAIDELLKTAALKK